MIIRSYLRSLRLFSRDVRLCLMSTALIGFAISGGIYTVLLNLYLLRMGYGPEFVGLVNAMSPLAIALFSLPAGAIGGRWGNRRTMIVGVILSVAGNGLLPLAEFVPHAMQGGWILTTYLLAGLGMSLYLVTVSPFVMDASTPEERNHVFSARWAILLLAGFAGSLVGGLLPGLFATALGISPEHAAPYRYSLLIAALLLGPAVLTLWATGEGGDRRAQEAASGTVPADYPHLSVQPAPLGLFAFLALIGFLRVMGEGVPRAFFNVYLDADLHVPTAQIGVLVATGRLLAVPAALVMPLLAARWGIDRTVVFGALGVSLSLLPLAFIPHWVAAGLGFIGMTALAAIARSAFTIYALEAVPARWQATMSGVATMAASVSWSATAFGGGYLVESLGYRGLFTIGACSTMVGALLFWVRFCMSRSRRK